MGYNSLILRSPKKEEQQVPDTILTNFSSSEGKDGNLVDEEVDIMDDLERILGINEDEDQKWTKSTANVGQLNWEFMDWGEFRNGEEEDEEEEEDIAEQKPLLFDKDNNKKYMKYFFEEVVEEEEEEGYYRRGNKDNTSIKKEQVGSGDEDYKVSLNLNLNYQEVLEAWSDRGSLWADEYSLSMATNGSYVSIH